MPPPTSTFLLSILLPLLFTMAICGPVRRLASDLKSFPTSAWGFVIYRTTYTPLSDREFPMVLQTINHHIRTALLAQRADARNSLGDQDPLASSLDIIWPRFKTTIMDDRSRFSVLLSYVRSDFESWLRSQKRDCDNSDHNICLSLRFGQLVPTCRFYMLNLAAMILY
ncbi:hypothetical protein ASPSYDRAFT_707830 [Aspergillus sydowii CBS 593.65]|uniref:Uncharacterized protein n=1 Tax=Aspergillus sydowii CBS 593.65 TaxID=1036612 RepID=A0A1L9SYW8_9EURO|nr:uncharacterized protein ASPSYDRAFT_707830 [Aspergillus sydowii CBS 593.65]OJJ52414.1 hypothetical protein ASPSYDRAFT_707830 [Aspergillus sydowii CBS 593.65]